MILAHRQRFSANTQRTALTATMVVELGAAGKPVARHLSAAKSSRRLQVIKLRREAPVARRPLGGGGGQQSPVERGLLTRALSELNARAFGPLARNQHRGAVRLEGKAGEASQTA